MIGRTLSHFRITGLLGEGGMGAVYRAVDTRLDRLVAIKLLPEAFVADPERLARFEREAKALAALDHPGIVRIYSLEAIDRDDGEGPLTFLVMELVEGETLEEEIPSDGLSLERFFELAASIAETVGAAHRRGIVHRDLKPANIMVTPDGGIKILDFGLAKWALSGAELDEPDEEAPTRTRHELTAENQIVGTGPYMSPEQIRSQPLDARSDIFSLGVVLYEMLAAERPFTGESSIDLISSILRQEPRDLAELRPEVPKSLRRLIERCLAKDPRDRFDSVSELARELRAVATAADEPDEPDGSDQAAQAAEESVEPGGRELDSRAVAVLPFTNLSGTEEAGVLATGLHNDVLTELSRIPGLTVISRTSVMAYEASAKPATSIGRELRVGTIVEGTVQSAGNRVRLTAQLIDAAEDAQRWAERYDRELSTETLFDLQSEVTERIVDSLQSELAPTLELPRAKPRTQDMEAYRLTTLGRVQHERRTESGCRRAIEHFESAVERDPDYAPAWAGLGEALAIAVWYRYLEADDRLERAEKAARRAVELDPESAEAHCALATCFGAVRNGPAAMRELETAVELQPSYWDAHNRLSYLNHLHGNARQALEGAERSVELNPLSPEAVSNLSL
ncbi:MAG: protein kinase, partial [Thermoanaerobaculia bacterium]|nr:protein kinase [Thermoanaerobaculia bacterium]